MGKSGFYKQFRGFSVQICQILAHLCAGFALVATIAHAAPPVTNGKFNCVENIARLRQFEGFELLDHMTTEKALLFPEEVLNKLSQQEANVYYLYQPVLDNFVKRLIQNGDRSIFNVNAGNYLYGRIDALVNRIKGHQSQEKLSYLDFILLNRAFVEIRTQFIVANHLAGDAANTLKHWESFDEAELLELWNKTQSRAPGKLLVVYKAFSAIDGLRMLTYPGAYLYISAKAESQPKNPNRKYTSIFNSLEEKNELIMPITAFRGRFKQALRELETNSVFSKAMTPAQKRAWQDFMNHLQFVSPAKTQRIMVSFIENIFRENPSNYGTPTPDAATVKQAAHNMIKAIKNIKKPHGKWEQSELFTRMFETRFLEELMDMSGGKLNKEHRLDRVIEALEALEKLSDEMSRR